MKRVATPLLLVSGCIAGFPAMAAGPGDTPDEILEPVVVSATRLRSIADVDVPASVSTVTMNSDSNTTQSNVTELLAGVPGVTALERQNYAQDTQLSIRGYGSRATFGVRGVRLYADGIPASMPDGQGQLSHYSVIGADRLQIMRGPFSALYGNSSGGVVQIWSRAGTPEPSARLRSTFGSHGEMTLGGQALGTSGPLNYNLAASRFETDGFRDHSAARRDSANLRLGLDLSADQKLTLVANYVDIPEAQDALGVTPDAWRLDPRGTVSVATQFNTRKSVEQLHGGLSFEQRLGAHNLRALVYTGNRKVVQYLAIPAAPQQNSATHAGGVIDLDGNYEGADLRWSFVSTLAGRPLEITAGTNFDRQNQLRRGYENFVGSELGVRGSLRRDETNTVRNFDQFAQAFLQLSRRWSAMAGLRHSAVKFRSADRYILDNGTPEDPTDDPNPDDSGTGKYSDTTVVAGLMFRPVAQLRVYASVGDGFETPTFNELSYRTDGDPGLAFDLRAARSQNYELGTKWRPAGGLEIDAALFRADTDNELVVARNTGGRSRFANVDRTRREGFEAALRMPLSFDLQLQAAYTLLDAKFRSDYLICSGVPCPTPNITVPAGSRIPGVPRHQGQLALQWTPGMWSAALEFDARSHIVVNDRATNQAPGFGLWNAEVGRNWPLSDSTLRSFARIDNLLDKTYVGSVIVNEGNSRFFEAGPERTAMIGLQWSWR
ncbi:MAG TPA: TonB-dependent receptor [Steroidobacteraceae bacterium]|nr:TonB-dependent receptor [Steroidobacteraceae bacterium]